MRLDEGRQRGDCDGEAVCVTEQSHRHSVSLVAVEEEVGQGKIRQMRPWHTDGSPRFRDRQRKRPKRPADISAMPVSLVFSLLQVSHGGG